MADRALATAFVNIVPGTVDLERYLKSQLGADVEDAGVGAGAGLAKGVGSGFGSRIKSYIAPALATMAASFGAIQIGGFLKDAITNASDFNEQGAAVGQVFGDAAATIQAFAAAGATSLGQSKTQVLDAAKTFGIYGKAAGLAGEDNANFSTGMVNLATDLASFNNTSVAEAIEAIGSGLRGEAEPLRRFGVLLDDATLRSQAMEMGLIKTTKQALTPQQKVLAAHAAIMSQTSTQQGDFARTSDGLANQQRILSANMENLGITVGTALLPMLTTLVSWTNGTMLPALQSTYEWFQKYGYIVANVGLVFLGIFLPAIITSMASAVTAWVTAAAAAITSSAQQLVASYKTIGGWVMQGVAATVNAAKTVAGWVVSAAAAVAGAASFIVQTAIVVGGWVVMGVQSLIQAARMAAAWLIAMGPIGWVIAAVVGLVALIIANWDSVSKWTAKAWTAVVDWVKGAAQTMVDLFMKWTLLGVIISNWDKIMAFFGELPAKFAAFGKNIIDGLINGVKNAAAGIGDFFADIADNAIQGFKKMMGIASPSKVFKEFGKNILQGLNKGLTGDAESVKEAMAKVSSWVKDSLDKGKLTKAAANAANALVKTYSTKLNALAKAHDAVLERLEEAQDRLADKLKEKADYAASIASKFGSALNIGEQTSAVDAAAQLRDRIAKNKELLAVLTNLKDMGLSNDLYQQVLESGNVDFAKSIEAGGAAAVTELNSLAAEANLTASTLGKTAGGVLFDQGIQMAQGIVDGLKAKEAELAEQMKRMADAFTSELTAVIKDGAIDPAKKAPAAKKTTSKTTKATTAQNLATDANKKSTLRKMATGGFVTRPVRALIGEAGPEVVTPLKDFERMMGLDNGGNGQTLNYYAAPNQSLDAEQALFQAMKRGKVLAGW